MVGSIPTPGSSPNEKPPKGQFEVSPAFKKFWTHLFHNQPLTPKQISKMTDQFINQVWNSCNRVLKEALKKQKELDKKTKEER